MRCADEPFFAREHQELKCLYKYYGPLGDGDVSSYALINLKNLLFHNSIYLSGAGQMNDPFENRPYYSGEIDPTFTYQTAVRLRNSFPDQMGTLFDEFPTKAKMLQNKGEIFRRLKPILEQVYKKQIDDIGFTCLSELPDSGLMWAHYGAKYSGFCVEFKITSECPFPAYATKVQYSKSRVEINYTEIDLRTGKFPDDKVIALLSTKSDEWSYENEWRFLGINPFVDPTEIYVPGTTLSFDNLPISSIIFGPCMNEGDKDKIHKLVYECKKKIKIRESYLDERHFKINFI